VIFPLLLAFDEEDPFLEGICSVFNRQYSNARLEYVKTNEGVRDRFRKEQYRVLFYDIGLDKDTHYGFTQEFKEANPGVYLIGSSIGTSIYLYREVPEGIFHDLMTLNGLIGLHRSDTTLRTVLERAELKLERIISP
jgi:hypothetical protein